MELIILNVLIVLYVHQTPFVIVKHTNVKNVYLQMLCSITNVYQFALMVSSPNQLILIEMFLFVMFVKNVHSLLSAIKKLILAELVQTVVIHALKPQPLVNLLVQKENSGTTSNVLFIGELMK